MINYLSSIPRAGNTLLASLLMQREDTHVSKTSNIGQLISVIIKDHNESLAALAGEIPQEELMTTLRAVLEAKYFNRDEKFIFDNGRCWPDPTNMGVLTDMMGESPKIVAMVRPMAECVVSFYLIDCPDRKIGIKEWVRTSELYSFLVRCYTSLENGYKQHPENFCLIEYENLCNHTQRELDRVSDFIGAPKVKFNPKIEQVGENDNAWGVKDLHLLHPTIEKTKMNTREILGEDLWDLFQGREFWNDKPEPVKKDKPLDIALELSLKGEYEASYQILRQVLKSNPEHDRTIFNLGWHEMRLGNYQKGHRFLACGRNVGVFGSPNPLSTKPLWNGQKECTVLLEMEGGLGDQFHAIRYAKEISSYYGNKVIISGSMPLVPIFREVEGVHAIVMREAANMIDHDYWVPSMSAAIPLSEEYSDLDGSAYISRLCESENKIGLRWLGNPLFEHEQHRLFDSQLMFDAVNDEDCISLQDEVSSIPSWIEQPSLETWRDTQMAISRCELVITSCTGVAHLAGAMGIETWIVVPILPYYLWALPGDKTPHYDSVTLYRQEKYGCWEAPFKKIKQDLITRRISKWEKLPMGESTLSFIEA